MMKRRILTGPRVIGVLLLLALGAALLVVTRTAPVDVEVGRVTRGPVTVTVADLGETRVRDLYVVSAPITGDLLRVPLKPGDQVLAGSTLLGRIRPPEPGPLDARTLAEARARIGAFEAQLAAAGARVREAEAEQALAEREFERVSALSGRGFISQASVDRARMARDRGRAAAVETRQGVEAARQSLAAARAALMGPRSGAGRGTVAVTSPVSGFVLRVPQESERVLLAGTPLVEIGDPERLEMVTDLLSADAVRVRPGAEALIEDWGGERPLRGRVRLVEPFGFTKISALGVEEQRVNVVVDFTEPRSAWSRLGHGYRGTVRIAVWEASDVVRVPVSALFRSGSGWNVFVVGVDGRAHQRAVELGPMSEELAVVQRGLRPGEGVILHPSEKVADRVRVREARF